MAEDITVVNSNQLPSEEEQIESPARETGRVPQKFYTTAETLIRLYITFHLMAEVEGQSHSKTDDT